MEYKSIKNADFSRLIAGFEYGYCSNAIEGNGGPHAIVYDAAKCEYRQSQLSGDTSLLIDANAYLSAGANCLWARSVNSKEAKDGFLQMKRRCFARIVNRIQKWLDYEITEAEKDAIKDALYYYKVYLQDEGAY